MNRSLTRRALVACAALLAAQVATAQDFPSRPIRWIVPYGAGTASDATTRIVADAMSGILRQAIVVDNRAGASGNIGAQAAAQSAPDGYTWLACTSAQAGAMAMYAKPGFDVLKDFKHLGRIGTTDSVLVVSTEGGIATLPELIERAQKNPGQLSFSSAGVGTPAHLGVELLLAKAGAQALHVPFKTNSQGVTAVLGGQVDFTLLNIVQAIPQIKAGKLRPLAVVAPQRNPGLPDVPTVAQASGIQHLNSQSFSGLSVPAATPNAVAQRIAGALSQALAQPRVRDALAAQGVDVAPASGAQFTAELATQTELAQRMMKAARLDPQ